MIHLEVRLLYMIGKKEPSYKQHVLAFQFSYTHSHQDMLIIIPQLLVRAIYQNLRLLLIDTN
jgi:hypothetical protein